MFSATPSVSRKFPTALPAEIPDSGHSIEAVPAKTPERRERHGSSRNGSTSTWLHSTRSFELSPNSPEADILPASPSRNSPLVRKTISPCVSDRKLTTFKEGSLETERSPPLPSIAQPFPSG